MILVVVAWVYTSKPNELYSWNKESLFYINYTSRKFILKEVIEKRNTVVKNKDAKNSINSRSTMTKKVVTKKVKVKIWLKILHEIIKKWKYEREFRRHGEQDKFHLPLIWVSQWKIDTI